MKRNIESIDIAPVKKQRIIGTKYIYKNKICIWADKWKCEHDRERSKCKECEGSHICEHGRIHSSCKECGGKSICEHGRRRSSCKECGGKSVCEHGRRRSSCRECGGSQVCEHKRQRSKCKECGGKSICEHERERVRCKECGGKLICEHERERSACKECGGKSICEHKRQRSVCKECGGGAICEHKRRRSDCKDCEGSQICHHCKFSLMNPKFKPHCAMCYYHLNPDVPQTRNYLTKQKYLHQWITSEIEHPFEYDRIIQGGCSKRRPDFYFDCVTHSVNVENDENVHSGVQCEDRRTMEIFNDLGNRPLVQIRFNPDSYTDAEGIRHKSCFQLNKDNKLVVDEVEWSRRWKVLKETLLTHLTTVPQKELSVLYLFYNDDKQ